MLFCLNPFSKFVKRLVFTSVDKFWGDSFLGWPIIRTCNVNGIHGFGPGIPKSPLPKNFAFFTLFNFGGGGKAIFIWTGLFRPSPLQSNLGTQSFRSLRSFGGGGHWSGHYPTFVWSVDCNPIFEVLWLPQTLFLALSSFWLVHSGPFYYWFSFSYGDSIVTCCKSTQHNQNIQKDMLQRRFSLHRHAPWKKRRRHRLFENNSCRKPGVDGRQMQGRAGPLPLCICVTAY